jgi:hypothetical protein
MQSQLSIIKGKCNAHDPSAHKNSLDPSFSTSSCHQTKSTYFSRQFKIGYPATSTLPSNIFSNICIIANASNNVPIMLAWMGCCTKTTSSTPPATSDYCYHYCNLTSSDEAREMGGCLVDTLTGIGMDLGSIDMELWLILEREPRVQRLMEGKEGFDHIRLSNCYGR